MATERTKGDRLEYSDVVLLRWETDDQYLVYDDDEDALLIYWNLTDRTPRDWV